jgi:hypothetical protein
MRKIVMIVLSVAVFTTVSAKDVYVRAGSSGNGTKSSPYGTIADAINMGVYAGDVIHVAEGVYYGEGGSGKWTIAINNLTLVGGYSTDFSSRDPWGNRSILVRGMGDGAFKQAKAREHDKKWGLSLTKTKASYNPKAMIAGEGNHSSTVIDGFTLDGYTRHTYKKNGDLKTDVGPIGTPLISLSKQGCKIRNCTIVNSGGPGIQLSAKGVKGDESTWSEVSNCVIVNTLMEAIDFRIGDMDPDRNPDGGYALIKDNTLAFVWTMNGEGYGILVGRQTKLRIENNIIAFATDFGLNNGFGNKKATLVDNCFFNNMGGHYRYFATKNKVTVVEDNPSLLSGKAARRKYYLSSKSAGNYIADPELTVDPGFFERFSNQVAADGGGKISMDDVNNWRSAMGLPLIGSSGSEKVNYAPIYEHDYLALASDSVEAGARNLPGRIPSYESKPVVSSKNYREISFSDLKNNLGSDVTMPVKFYSSVDPTSYYVEGVTRDTHVCYRSADRNTFLYVPNGSEALEVIRECIADGIPAIVSGTAVDIKSAINMSNKYGFIVDRAVYDED